MSLRRLLSLFAGAAFVCCTAAMEHAGSFATGQYRNLFTELLGKTDAEVQAKIDAAWAHFFEGRDEDQRLFYPVGADQAYIADVGNGDVRSEGMSYGLMLAVQLDRRAEFDRLWRWAKAHMYHAAGPRRGYFAWQCRFDGTHIDAGSASDGEEWFAMALLFAANRWGQPSGSGDIDYAAEAQALLDAMRDNARGGEITAIFDAEHRQVVFAPTAQASRFTDPSYHLPFFYELWARWDRDEEGRRFWAACAAESRAFFRRAAHASTGLMPEYAHFDGRPVAGPQGDFRYDAWRTLAHVALDHAWFAADPWQVERSNRVLRFLLGQGAFIPDRYTVDGQPISTDESIGLVAMAAVAGLAADPENSRPFLQRLWDAPPPEGRWRYYNGLLYFLALLEAGGRFRVHPPVTSAR
ncbi:MAG TPA: glycosyl hydrolase family 8 [Opitutaceae bacterium]|nr:glycosyl hydrolase family 8 [Opitutaceae bacterium]